MLIVLLDTNIWVSATISPHGFPAKLLNEWKNGRFNVVVSIPLLEEIADVLARPRIQRKYGVTAADIEELLLLISQRAVHVAVQGTVNICRDPDDDLILETAIVGNATYLVSRDGDVKGDDVVMEYMAEQGVNIVSINQFWTLLQSLDE